MRHMSRLLDSETVFEEDFTEEDKEYGRCRQTAVRLGGNLFMVLLLGLGDLLLSDDGVGIHICRSVDERLGYLPGVDLAEGILQVSPSPTNGLSGTSVIMTLGLESDGTVGELVSLRGDRITNASAKLAASATFRLNRLVIELEGFGIRRPDIQIHAVTIADAEPGIGLSAPVAAAKAQVVELILDDLRARANQSWRHGSASHASRRALAAHDRLGVGGRQQHLRDRVVGLRAPVARPMQAGLVLNADGAEMVSQHPGHRALRPDDPKGPINRNEGLEQYAQEIDWPDSDSTDLQRRRVA